VQRLPGKRPVSSGSGEGEPSQALFSAMKTVSIVALQATVQSDGVSFAATGLSADAESRGLLEEPLRGVLAMWRLAIQDTAPQLVAVIRRFQIDNDSDGVSIRGTLPSEFLNSLVAKHRASR